MGALRNYLPIECYCSEKQMDKIVSAITTHIYDSHVTDISDFDDSFDDIRVCVEFEPYLDKLGLKTAEVLDNDWDLLYGDSAVLTSRLRTILRDYNKESREIYRQSMDILEDQRA